MFAPSICATAATWYNGIAICTIYALPSEVIESLLSRRSRDEFWMRSTDSQGPESHQRFEDPLCDRLTLVQVRRLALRYKIRSAVASMTFDQWRREELMSTLIAPHRCVLDRQSSIDIVSNNVY
jgi:hypothetical protein